MPKHNSHVAFFIPYGGKKSHYERMLEVTQRLLDHNRPVIIFTCNKQMLSCKINLNHKMHVCRYCINRGKKGRRLLNGKFHVEDFAHGHLDTDSILNSLSSVNWGSLSDLKQLYYKDFNVGMGVASTLIWQFRSLDLLKHVSVSTIKDKVLTAAFVYDSLLSKLYNHNIRYLFLHNGRHANQRAAIAAARKLNIKFISVEAAHKLQHKYCIYRNSFPQNPYYRRKVIENFWEISSATQNEKYNIGLNFFKKRLNKNVETGRVDHTSKQINQYLPEWWDDNLENIVFFNKSPFEFLALGNEVSSSLYDDEYTACSKISESVKNASNIRLILRLHPNLMHGDTNIVERFNQLSTSNLYVIPPDSNVDTYYLMDKADKILTFMSTAGIEAAYKGKPVIILGTPFYGQLGSTYEPSSHEEVVQYILTSKLQSLSSIGAIKYGYYKEAYGIDYKYSSVIHGNLSFKGVSLDNPISEYVNSFKRKIKKHIKNLG